MPSVLYCPTGSQLRTNEICREPTRPPLYRSGDFHEKFDDKTLFYDTILSPCGTSVLMLGPPLNNLGMAINASSFTAFPSGIRVIPKIRNMDRHSQVRLRVPIGTDKIIIEGDLGRYIISPRDPQHSLFAGKRVLMTLSKNNELRWLKDWIRYNRDIHGANAILIYDNASTKYSNTDILEAINDVSGIESACVVDWPYKYGPQGIDEIRFWDSDFCQRGMMEHARWFFLQDSSSVLNGDIDELVVCPGNKSIFKMAEQSLTGMKRFHGVWVYGLESSPVPQSTDPISYSSFEFYLNPARASEVWHRDGMVNTKWAVVPRRCPARFQWSTHEIIGFRGFYSRLSLSHRCIYRHYREISDSWFYDRTNRPRYDPSVFVRDDSMIRNLAMVDWTR